MITHLLVTILKTTIEHPYKNTDEYLQMTYYLWDDKNWWTRKFGKKIRYAVGYIDSKTAAHKKTEDLIIAEIDKYGFESLYTRKIVDISLSDLQALIPKQVEQIKMFLSTSTITVSVQYQNKQEFKL